MAHVLAQDLRNAVLQAAIQGKLVANYRNEKAVCVKECTTSNLDDIGSENWRFAYLEDINKVIDCPHSTPSYVDTFNGYLCLRTRELKQGKIEWERLLFLDKETYTQRIARYKPVKGDIVYAREGNYGVCAIIDKDTPLALGQRLVVLSSNETIALSKYIYYVLISDYCLKQALEKQKGMTAIHVNVKDIKKFIIPLPPIEEQARIVARVDELMEKIDEYEKIEKELTDLQKAFPGNMKDAILQAAMQGKLTEQLESDEDVYKFLDNIASLKASLIKEKKLKKDKTTDTVEDEYPFDIPDNWAWTKFGAIASLRSGKTPPRAEPIWWGDKNDVPWVSIADMIADGHVSKTKEFISQAGFKEKFKEAISPAGTMIMSFKLTVGRVSYLDIDALHNEAIISIFPFKDENNILQSYLFKVLPYLTQYGDSKNAIKGTTLNADSLCNLYIPLPPLEEQQRIVDKLDQLLPLCEQLEKITA